MFPSKIIFRLTVIIAGLSLVGCAPVVYTGIIKSYPPITSADSVVVFAPNDLIPEEAEVLGDVTVTDSGFSTGCGYEKVIGIAQQKTAETGGNAFAVTEHKLPSMLGSTCHRIKGYMLRCADPYHYEGPYTISIDTAYPALTDIPQAAAQHSSPVDSLPVHTFFINAGYSAIISKIITPPGTSKNGRNGWGFSAGYRWLSQRGFGVGIIYEGHRSVMRVTGIENVISIHYFAPELVLSHRYGKWLLTGTVGFGYACYKEKADFSVLHDPTIPDTYTRNGVGSHFTGSFEYLASKYIGIGATIGCYSCRYSKIEGEEEFDSAGLYRFTLSAGVNFHF